MLYDVRNQVGKSTYMLSFTMFSFFSTECLECEEDFDLENGYFFLSILKYLFIWKTIESAKANVKEGTFFQARQKAVKSVQRIVRIAWEKTIA